MSAKFVRPGVSSYPHSRKEHVRSKKREEFLKKYKAKLFEAYGAVLKEYVAVPDSLLKNTKELQPVSAIELRIRKIAEAEADQEKN